MGDEKAFLDSRARNEKRLVVLWPFCGAQESLEVDKAARFMRSRLCEVEVLSM